MLTTTPASAGTQPARPALLASLAGALAAAVALGVGELAAALIGPAGSPLIAVGQGVIRVVPETVKRVAIDVFGQYDKAALIVGTLLLLAVFAVAVGALSRRSLHRGYVGIGLLASVGAIAAGTAPAGGILAALPSLAGGIAGGYALRRMIGALGVPSGRRTPTPTDADPGSSSPRGPDTESRGAFDRRQFLTVSSVAAATAAVSGGSGLLLKSKLDISAARAALVIPAPTSPAPPLAAGADLVKAKKIRELTSLFTPSADFYRIDTALRVPQVDPDTWRLRIHGRVDRPVTLSLKDLLRRDLIERDLTLACVSNEVGGDLNGTARFIGVPLGPLLGQLGLRSGAEQIFTTSVDGFTASVQTAAVMDGRDAMLAVAMNGEPLLAEHGFPVRMVVPGLFGYVSATKWISDMELMTYDDRPAYWSKRGWSELGPVKTFSRIDVPASGADLAEGKVVVAGVAYAMHRGIDKVEVRVDDGPWLTATLSPEDNPDIWRQWYLPWEASAGDHTLTVRATDGQGVTQTATEVGPVPNGATGLDTRDVSIG